MYLCVILDLCDRRVVAYVLSDHNDNQLVLDTFDQAVKENLSAHPIFHSDYAEENTMPKFCIKPYTKPMFQIFSA